MGFVISKLLDVWNPPKETKILIVGLDCAGKSTILYRMKLGKVVEVVPTIGFNIETIKYKNINFYVWDIGRCALRIIPHYYENTQGLIFVVDSSDPDRISIAKEELMGILDTDEMKDCPLLVFANKIDAKKMSVAEIVDNLGLNRIRGK